MRKLILGLCLLAFSCSGAVVSNLIDIGTSTLKTVNASGTVTASNFVGSAAGLTNEPGVMEYDKSMPAFVSNYVYATYWNTNNTIWVDTNGNDATAAMGNPNLPAQTLTNAYQLMPVGGTIWLKYGQYFYSTNTGSATLTFAKPGTIVAIGVTIYPWNSFGIKFGTNTTIWGGTWDQYHPSQIDSGNSWLGLWGFINAAAGITQQCSMHWVFCNGFIDNGDTFSGNATRFLELDHYKGWSSYDIVNAPGNTSFLARDSVFYCDTIRDGTYIAQLNRNIYLGSGTGINYWKNCDFLSLHGSGVSGTESCFWIDNSAAYTNTFDGCRFQSSLVTGVLTNHYWLVFSNSPNSSVSFINMNVPTNMVAWDGQGVLRYNAQQPQADYTGSFTGSHTGNGSGLTNLNISVSFLPTNALSTWPTAPQTRGGSALVNSNGTLFWLTSLPASATWAATNKIVP